MFRFPLLPPRHLSILRSSILRWAIPRLAMPPLANTALLAAIIVTLVACSATGPARQPSDVVIRKSPNDDREYRYVRLPNQLQVVLISDPTTDRAAASLTAFRGSYDNPAEYPGLAHFLEHMLFIGTQKYPEVDQYQTFLKAHGGSSNAYTAKDHTNYFFDVQPAFLTEALDRFAQFFIAPLLDPTYVDREKNAVHQEYQYRLNDDGRRRSMAAKKAVNPQHPEAGFSIGALATLGDGVHEALVDFREAHYSANQMALVVLGKESLDELAAIVSPTFNEIANRALGESPVTVPAYENLPVHVVSKSLKNAHVVIYKFPLPSLDQHYRSQPAQYTGNMIGHEGDGSLHKLLKDRGWILSLGAGSNRFDDNGAMMVVHMELTDVGATHVPEITDLLFDYVDLVREQEPEQWRFDEQSRVRELGFRFQEKTPPQSLVSALSPLLAHYPPSDLLTAGTLMETFDPALIKSILTHIRPENVVVEYSGPDVDTDQVEEWFKVPYRVTRGAIARARADSGALHLPEANPFLPENLDILPTNAALPTLAFDRDDTEIWLDQDTEFSVPRALLQVSLRPDGGLVSLEDRVNAALYTRLVSDALNSLAYPALMAGVGYSIVTPPKGLRVAISGYNDKQMVLLDRVLNEIANHKVDESRFATLKADFIKDLQNFKIEAPYRQAMTASQNLVVTSGWLPAAQAEALQDVTSASIARWYQKKFARIEVRSLYHGNVGEPSLDQLNAVISNYFTTGNINLTDGSVVDINHAYRHEVKVDHADSAMVLYVQDNDDSYKNRALSALSAQLINAAYFTSVRTEQQLGYVVAALSSEIKNRGGIFFVVQSTGAPADHLEKVTIEFIEQQLSMIPYIPAEAFDQHKSGLISRLTKSDENLGQRHSRFWADLESDVTTFDSNQRVARAVVPLETGDVIEFLSELRTKLDDQRLFVFSRGKFDTFPENGSIVNSTADLK